jgi:hypothetical protein
VDVKGRLNWGIKICGMFLRKHKTIRAAHRTALRASIVTHFVNFQFSLIAHKQFFGSLGICGFDGYDVHAIRKAGKV